MKIIKISLLSLGLLFAVTSCKQNKEENTTTPAETVVPAESTTDTINTAEVFQPQTVNDELAVKIKDFLNTSFLKAEDLKVLTADEKKFQLFQIDLNNDGKNEVFVYLNSPYFCGSGGCTVLLLNDELKLITKFTVTRPPFYAEPTEKNGWKVLAVQSENEWKELVFNNGTYPSNPSVAKKATFEKPSEKAEVIFDSAAKAKSYEF